VAEIAFKQKLFVGLGNPGSKYELTRHNMGYLIVQGVAECQHWRLKETKQFHGMSVKGQIDNAIVHLLLPSTYMNLSGQAVRAYLDYFKIPYDQMIVICDDTALEFGEMRLKAKGSAGGHNGLKSIEAHVGTREYVRLRVGIGRHPTQGLADYVLDRFTQEELQCLPDVIKQGAEITMRLLNEEIATVMNAVNTKSRKISRPHGEGQENKS
jgi:PTH1 family peptidyl-tRNA hydrolase